ncbi:hypothetical protein PRK78_007411 [Emydomyces testavorans]|uniref:MYND-type domain-containing protein n=1 Tax=Emydomyces testavorans TaxID=2070801 RepID=A0AAF0DRD6_9EURO|nr:hypothetical protein PRK78_007411 [Emydomyces testavorans]
MASTVLPSGCGVCGKKKDLLRCSGCKVMPYCGREHQAAHYPSHKSACNAIKKHRRRMEEEEQLLRNHPDDIFIPPGDPFVTSVGNFWGIYPTRDYMRARFALADTMRRVKNVESVQAQLDHFMDMLRLCRGDNMGLRALVPALMLRLNKDQECYDFLKWWNVTAADSDYDWEDMSGPYLDCQNADVFEPIDGFCRKYVELSHTVALLLLKIKSLFDLLRLEQSSSALRPKVPQEILDLVLLFVPQSPAVAAHHEIIHGETRQALIEKLKTQINELYTHIDRANIHFWPAFMTPEKHLDALPASFSLGSVEEMQLVLKWNYDAWIETHGAIEFIMAKIQEKLF